MCLGSFASVLIYRIPRDINLLLPASHCSHCKKNLKPLHLIPVLSYVFLRGKCHFCNHKISRLYLLNEIFITTLAVLTIYLTGIYSIHGWLVIGLILCLYVQAVIDLRILFLSTYLSGIICFLGIVLNYLNFYTTIIDSFLGIILGFSSLWLINYIYKKIKGFDGIGSGDFLLLGAVVGVFGSSSLGVILLASSILSLGLYIFTKNHHGERIPLGTGIASSSIIFLFLIILNL
tara:strand:+ start:1829 stop:2527 length:699 start_codon:yes stop_codon:yes gene_type:complete